MVEDELSICRAKYTGNLKIGVAITPRAPMWSFINLYKVFNAIIITSMKGELWKISSVYFWYI